MHHTYNFYMITGLLPLPGGGPASPACSRAEAQLRASPDGPTGHGLHTGQLRARVHPGHHSLPRFGGCHMDRHHSGDKLGGSGGNGLWFQLGI